MTRYYLFPSFLTTFFLPELEIPASPSSPENDNLTSKPTSSVFQMNQLLFFSDALTDGGISAGSLVSCHVFTSCHGQGVKAPITVGIKSMNSVECSDNQTKSQSLSWTLSIVHTQIFHVSFGQDSAHVNVHVDICICPEVSRQTVFLFHFLKLGSSIDFLFIISGMHLTSYALLRLQQEYLVQFCAAWYRRHGLAGASPVQGHRDDQRTGSIFHMRRGWEKWDCLAWRREGPGGFYQIKEMPEGK